MGVIVLKNNKDAWGGGGRLIYSILDYCVKNSVKSERLSDFKSAFDLGYNSIRLYELNDSELHEFLQLLRSYRNERAYIPLEYDERQVVELLNDLIERVTEMDNNRRKRQ